MVILFKNTNGLINCGALSNIIPTPITNLTATSTVAGQITLSWSGGIGQNVKYSYVLSTGTIQSVSGTASPVTITLTSTNQVTTTVTLTATVLGGSTSVVSNSVTTVIPSTSVASLNVYSWYNPDNVVVTGGVVTSIVDSENNYNLNTTLIGGTNCVTKVQLTLNSKLVNVLYSQANGSNITTYYNTSAMSSGSVYCAILAYNITAIQTAGSINLETILGDQTVGTSIRCTISVTNPSLNNYDLGYGSTNKWYLNGTNVKTGTNTTNFTISSPPSGWIIFSIYVGGSETGLITKPLLFNGEGYFNTGSPLANQRPFTGYLGDVFLINANNSGTFTLAMQQQLEGYLGYKYGLQSSLPIAHPYYSATNSNLVSLSP